MSEQSNTGSGQAGQGVGDAIKGIFNAGHGAGETIRGTINNTLDSFGEGLANDGKSTGTDSSRLNKLEGSGHTPQDHSSVVDKGKQEFSQGVESIANAGGQNRTA